MTDSVVTGGIVLANSLAVASLATAGDINLILEYIQNGASVGAIMGIFLWREVKRAERYEHLYHDERKLRIQAENKCIKCPFVKHTKVSISSRHPEKQSCDYPENTEGES